MTRSQQDSIRTTKVKARSLLQDWTPGSLEEVYLASAEPALRPLVLTEDLMRTDVRPLTPDDTLDRALELFVENDLPALPVVDDREQRTLLGMVRRHEITGAYLRHVHGPACE